MANRYRMRYASINTNFLGHNRWDIQLSIFTPFLSQPACGAALAAVYSGQVTISLKTIPKRMGISSGEIFLTEVLFLRNVLFIVFAHGCFVNVDTPLHQSVDDNYVHQNSQTIAVNSLMIG